MISLTPVAIAVLTALITSLIGPTMVEWIKLKFFHKKYKDVLGEAIYVDEKVDQQLEIIMSELNCDRLCLAQFHNGGHFYPTGKSIKKFSVFYERVTDKAPSVKETFQNIPVSLFPKIFSLLYKEGEVAIPDTSNNTVNCGIFPVKGKDYNTKSFYALAIKDLHNNFIGTLVIAYYGEKIGRAHV